MATNVLVDDKMVKEALKLGNFKTKQEAMHVAPAPVAAKALLPQADCRDRLPL